MFLALIQHVRRPVKGVTFTFDEDVHLEDNGLDLVPGHEKTISVTPTKAGQIEISRPTCRWYNSPAAIC